LPAGPKTFGGIFDYERRSDRLAEVERELAGPGLLEDPPRAQALGREQSSLQGVVHGLDRVTTSLVDLAELTELAVADQDADALGDIDDELAAVADTLADLEFRRMFQGEQDESNAFLDVQAGSGGTDAQDWAEMLLRMYLRWGEKRGFRTDLVEVSAGEVAGIKSATIQFGGAYAYGWLRTETGIHRLVRKSPFDAGNRRHTSFASIFVAAEIDDNIVIDIDPSDVRTDTYRASGAGGQHVNTTDSAVRLTHLPTGIVVQCQSERSQHQNRDKAYKQLRAKLHELEEQKRRQAQQAIEDAKEEISWGRQIRSYVLDQPRVKDLRTEVERFDPGNVLDGDLDAFMEASLKAGV
jgi:peptide chain release factor 2